MRLGQTITVVPDGLSKEERARFLNTARAKRRRRKLAAKREAQMIRPEGYISRSEAIAAGLTRYFTGLPCPKGHICERKVQPSGGACVMCLRLVAHTAKKKTSEAWKKEKARLYARRKKTPAARASHNLRNARWRAGNLNNRLRNNLRRRISMAVETDARRGSAVRDLGCTIPEFKAYIAAQFRHGMCWENWGTVWHLDHIRALAMFDLTDRAQFLVACHYSNHQPLFIDEHRTKTQTEMLRDKAGRYASDRGDYPDAT